MSLLEIPGKLGNLMSTGLWSPYSL